MTFYGYINANIDRIRRETKIGLIPIAILRHWETYSRYDLYKKMDHSVVMAVRFASKDMKISERMTFTIIKKMETDV